MITINTAKGLSRIETWDDVAGRAGFTNDLDPSKHELASIVGRYVFGDVIRCGLSNCHAPHARGYIVATKDGRETNIGKDCGKKYFGVDFEEQARQFDRDITEQENREILWSFSFQLPEFDAKIAEVRAGKNGADWVHKHCQTLLGMNPRLPKAMVRVLANLVKTKSNILTKQRLASEQETENLETMGGKRLPRPYYIDEPYAELAGVEALYAENDLRELVILRMEEEAKTFRRKDIDIMSFLELTRWKKWVTSVDATFEAAWAAVGFGRLLLTRENLVALADIGGLEKDDRDSLEVFFASLG
ncbi:hypothetical protein AAKU55_005755 [Oxalobacteraceae bacterium GrIS 1.11]